MFDPTYEAEKNYEDELKMLQSSFLQKSLEGIPENTLKSTTYFDSASFLNIGKNKYAEFRSIKPYNLFNFLYSLIFVISFIKYYRFRTYKAGTNGIPIVLIHGAGLTSMSFALFTVY